MNCGRLAPIRIDYVNRSFKERFGYSLEEIPTLNEWYYKAYPDLGYRSTVSLLLRGTSVKGVLQIPATMPLIEADEGQLSQALHNRVNKHGGRIKACSSGQGTVFTTFLPSATVVAVAPVLKDCY